MLSTSQQLIEITRLFERWSGESPLEVTALPMSGSDRKYYRIKYTRGSLLGAYNPVAEENRAFINFTRHFSKLRLPVPEIIAEDTSKNIYLLEDLGDITLFSLLPHTYDQVYFEPKIIGLYKDILDLLPRFQIDAVDGFDFSACYPRQVFDRSSMLWDLNYFKYYFLRLAGIIHDEQKLEDDFQAFVDFLLEADHSYFLYRDFQSRNIMIHNGTPWFIDYQGGRKGALQYDLASLLYDAKANLHPQQREVLLDYYINSAQKHTHIDTIKFKEYFYGFVLIRIMQAMGAYGFRGFYEKKTLFLQSIPFALRNLRWLIDNDKMPAGLSYLTSLLEKIIVSPELKKYETPPASLKVTIRSFSYKKGIPSDNSGNGGGFVFDCRSLPNPGKEERYKKKTGKNLEVIQYLENTPAVAEFIENTNRLVENTVNAYLQRGFTHLMVCFGCTGGQHRSVYAAELLARHLENKYPITIDLLHCEEQSWPIEM